MVSRLLLSLHRLSGGPPDPSRTTERASRPLQDFRESLPTPTGLPGGPPDPSQPLSTPPSLPGYPPGLLGGPPDPSWTFGRVSLTSRKLSRILGRASQSLTDFLEGLPTPLDYSQTSWKDSLPLSTTPGLPGGSPDPSRNSRRASRPLTNFREGLLTPPRLPIGPLDPSQPFPDFKDVIPNFREDLPTPTGLPGSPPDSSRTSGKAS